MKEFFEELQKCNMLFSPQKYDVLKNFGETIEKEIKITEEKVIKYYTDYNNSDNNSNNNQNRSLKVNIFNDNNNNHNINNENQFNKRNVDNKNFINLFG